MSGGAWLPAEIPDRTRLVPMPTGRVFACDVGPLGAPPLVLLHGLMATHHAFHRVIPLLSADHRVVALDLPGCGDSDHPPVSAADDYAPTWVAGIVEQCLGGLGIEDADLLGHDYGGAVALALAASHPQRVRRLVLVDALASGARVPLEGVLALSTSLGAAVLKRGLRRADVRKFFAAGFSAPELLSDSDVDVFWDRLGRPGAREATHAMLCQTAQLDKLAEALMQIQAPSLVVWGDRDAVADLGQGERLTRALHEAELVLIEGCGHHPHAERPEKFAAVVRDFLTPEPPTPVS